MHGRARGGAHAGAGVLPAGRGRHGDPHRLRARAPEPPDGARAAGLVGRPVDDADSRGVSGELRGGPSATGRRRRPTPSASVAGPDITSFPTVRRRRRWRGRRRSTTSCTCATTPSACSVTSASTPAATSTRTRSRSRSPAAGSTRTSRPSTRRRCRSRRASTAATASQVCPTGALMPSHEYELREAANGTSRARHTTDTICAFCGVGCSLDAARPGRPDRQGDLARRPRRDAREPVHQGPVRVRARPGLRARPGRGSGRGGTARSRRLSFARSIGDIRRRTGDDVKRQTVQRGATLVTGIRHMRA